LSEIFLKDAKVSLITIMAPNGDFSLRKPAIGVFASLDESNTPDYDKDPENPTVLSAFMVKDIKPVSNKVHDARVKVIFEAPFGPESAPTEYSFNTEIHFMALAMALGAVNAPAGGLPMYFIDSNQYKANPKFSMTPGQFEFAVILPPKEYTEGEELSEKLAAMVHADYAVPLAPVPWDAIAESDEPNPLMRAAQSKLFMILLGLARGEVSPLMELMNMEESIDLFAAEEEDDDTDDEEMVQMEILSLCVTIAQNAFRRITTLNPELQTAAKGIDSVSTIDYNPQVDLVFSKLVNDPEVMGIFKDVKIAAKDKSKQEILREENIKTWNEPFSTSWPEPMTAIEEYLDTLEDADIYRELIDLDFSDNELVAEKTDDYGLGKIFTSLCISISSYALKKGVTALKSSDITVPAPLILCSWVNIFEDSYVWELPALTSSLSTYSFNNAVDVLTMFYEPAHDIEKAFYLWSVVHALGHHITNSDDWNDYTPEHLAKDLNSLEINTQEFADFKSWILRFFRKIQEVNNAENDFGGADEHPSDACAVSEAMHDFIDPEMDIQKMAEVVAMAFPVFADILATRAGLEPGNEDWNSHRNTYIYEMLTEISEEFGDRILFALR
jgi:hypothetical protein